MAALTTVMILFFIMALVAAYTNRNLIFEQRISANGYRANRALAAADAGVEWTLALLNGGRVDGNCLPSINAGNTDFRSRYLADPGGGTGSNGLAWGANPANMVYPACIIRQGVTSCICPAVGGVVADIGAPADGIGSSFRISFLLPGSLQRPGAMEFSSRGCANPGSGNSACFAQAGNAALVVDGVAGALSTVGLVRALPIPPGAALTAGTTVDATGGGLTIVTNSSLEPQATMTVHSGSTITAPANCSLTLGASSNPLGPTCDEGKAEGDAALAALAAGNGWFRSMFGMPMADYRRQPAVVQVDCNAGCTLANLNNVLAGFPRNPIWVEGNLNIDSVANLGSAANPLMLIVNGNLTISANATMVGFIHANRITWSSPATLTGAMVSATSFTATAMATIVYDDAALNTIQMRYGSFVRAPGGWNLTNF